MPESIKQNKAKVILQHLPEAQHSNHLLAWELKVCTNSFSVSPCLPWCILCSNVCDSSLSYKHDTKLLTLDLEKLKEAYSIKGSHSATQPVINDTQSRPQCAVPHNSGMAHWGCHRWYRRDTRTLLGSISLAKTVTRTVVVTQRWIVILAKMIVMLDFLRHMPLISW
jgi:hypothetical protein